jgi:predicted phage terminase large subunit-like protein
MKLRPAKAEILAEPQRKQAIAISCPADVVLFGGAVGGGKSETLKLKVLQHERKYGKYASMLLLRRSIPELRDLKKRLAALLPRLGCKWLEQKQEWRFPSGGVLYIGYLENEKDAEKYWGHEYSLILIDEVGHYADSAPIDKVASRLRSTAPEEVGVHCQLYLTANPGGAGHAWLKERFIDGKEPLTIWSEPSEDEDEADALTYCYIPSYLSDNKYLRYNKKYFAFVKKSGPSWFVRALMRGDWSVSVNGNIFLREWFFDNRYEEVPPHEEVLATIQSWDLAAKIQKNNDRSACTTWAITEKAVYLIHSWAGRLEFPDMRRKAEDLYNRFKPALVLVEDASAGIQLIQTLRRETRLPIYAVKPLGNKTDRARAMSLHFEASPRKILFPKQADWLDEVIEELCAFDKAPHDDLVDSVVQAIAYIFKRWDLSGVVGFEASVELVKPGVPKSLRQDPPASATQKFNEPARDPEPEPDDHYGYDEYSGQEEVGI